MADLDDGYTPIAHELLEEISKRKLNGTQSSIVTFIFRSTYGWRKKCYDMSITFIANGIEANKDQVRRELNKLIEWRMIRVFEESTSTKSRSLGINKNCEEWNAPRHRGLISTQGAKKHTGGESVRKEGAKKHSLGRGGLAPQNKYTLININKEYIYTLFEFWNTKKIIVHKELTDTTRSAVNARLQIHSLELLLEAIENYHACLIGKEYYYTHKFTLKDFMNPKNLDKFLTENNPFETFKDRSKKGKQQNDIYQMGKELEAEMNEP